MRHLEVLVVTEKTTETRVLNWKVSTVTDVETAIENVQQRPYQVVAISNTISEMNRTKLHLILPVLSNDILVVDYTADANVSEIVKNAYWSKNKPHATRNYLDNSFEMTLANSLDLN
jgi:DNA-binding NtrC family response regulator